MLDDSIPNSGITYFDGFPIYCDSTNSTVCIMYNASNDVWHDYKSSTEDVGRIWLQGVLQVK